MEKYLSEADINNSVLINPGNRGRGYAGMPPRIEITPAIECILREQFKRAVEYTFDYIDDHYGMEPALLDKFKKAVLSGV